MSYKHITTIRRSQFYVMRQAGKGNNEIARIIDRDKGLKGCRHQQAHRKAEASALRPGSRRFTEDVRLVAEENLRKGETGRAAARVQGEGLQARVRGREGGRRPVDTCLPRAKRKRRRRCPRQNGRGRGLIPGRRAIKTRLPEVELRAEVGR